MKALTNTLLITVTLLASNLLSAQYNIFGTATPSATYAPDNPVELGTRFKATSSGYVTAIRFYKHVSNNGSHSGHLWTAGGTLLGSVSFTGETSSGWQTATFSSPISISANTEYIASYYTTTGYSATNNFFGTDHVNGPLTAPECPFSNSGVNGNGVYTYDGGFPDSTFSKSNYWVDPVVDFDDATAPSSPTICYISKTGTTISLKISGATDNIAVSEYVVYNGATQLATFAYNTDPDHVYIITGLTAGTTYSDIKAKAKDLDNNISSASNSISRKTLPVNLLFDEGFEGACPWDAWQLGQDNLGENGNTWARQQSTTANEGSHSFRAEVRPGCDGCQSSGYRSEIQPLGVTDEDERWYGFSIRFNSPEDGGEWDGTYGHYIQWHPASSGGGAVLALLGEGAEEGWLLGVNADGNGFVRYESDEPITTNTWHHVVFNVNWDTDPGAGFVKVWIDGDLKWNVTSITWEDPGRYLKLGMNRWGPNVDSTCAPECPSPRPLVSTGTWAIYYDNLKIGNGDATYNDVAPITDEEDPSAVTLSTTNQTTTTVALSWTEATDNVEVTGYDIYVNGSYVTTTTDLTHTLTGLTSCTEYTIYVKSKDAAGNTTNSNTIVVSTDCPAACVTILTTDTKTNNNPNTHNLTNVPAGALLVLSVHAETSGQTAVPDSDPELTWTKRVDAQASSKGDAEIWTAVFAAGGDISVYSNFGGSVNQSSVCYVVWNNDPALGGATASTTTGTAPSLNITTTRANSIIIGGISDWNAVDGTSSRTYRDGSAIETLYQYVNGGFTSYHFKRNASTATTYTEGLSAPTGQASGTVLYELRCAEAETTAPTPPGLCITDKTGTSITIDDATAATDNVAVTGYIVYVVGGSSYTTLSLPYTITGLTAGVSYNIYVRARDASGNVSAASTTITGKTLAPHVLFDEGFESCAPWTNWTTTQDAGHAWSRQQSATQASEGTKSFRAEVRSGCDGYVSSGYRSEILPVDVVDEDVRWYGVSIYFDAPYSSGDWTGSYSGTFLQWDPEGTSGSSVLALIGSEGKWNLLTNAGGWYDTREHNSNVQITRGWHHIVFKVNWDEGGYVQVWIDGNLVFDLEDGENSTYYNPEDLDWQTGRYLKVGMSRWGNCNTSGCPSGSQGPCDTWILYYDNVRIGDGSATYEDVAPLALIEESSRNGTITQTPETVIKSEKGFSLGQNFPNPVTGTASIPFSLPTPENVNLVLMDQAGRVVKLLASGSFNSGNHIINIESKTLSKGVYFYKLHAGNFTAVKKMIVQ